MSLRIDRAELEIVIKNDSSRTKLREIEDNMKNIRKEMRKFKENTPEWEALNKQLQGLAQEYDDVYNSIGLVNLSTRELRNRQRELNAILQHLPPTHPLYDQYRQQLDSVNNRLRELRGNAQNTGLSLSRMADGFNKYMGIAAAAVATITGMSYTFRKLSEDVAQLDDVYSDVMKTTGMTRDQVLDLNETFKKMDTRTPREELNNLARDAGKLAITGKENITGFVDAANQINVALGEDLGEGAIKSIGKIVSSYEKSTKFLKGLDLKDQMLAVGSAINELGASSTASEEYLVSFTGRIGGIATQAGITVDQIMGYASGLDQNMQALEMSATSLQQLIMKIMGEPAKFAKIAGVNVKEFSNLVKTDMNGALLAVLKNLQGKGGLEQLIPIFKEMGLDGARASQVISSLAGNIDQIVEAQAIANQALLEGTSLTNEYNTKNNNLQATLEKQRKIFQDAALELGEKLNPALLQSTNAMTYVIKLLPGLIDWFSKYGKTLLYIITIGAGYIAGVKLQVLWNTKLSTAISLTNIQLKLKAIRLATAEAATHLYWMTVSILSGRLQDARRSFIAFNAVMKTNSIGLVVALIVAAAGAIYLMATRTKELTTSSKLLSDVRKEATQSISGEKAELGLLLSVAKNEKISKEERLKAIKRLNEISPEYLGNLNLENINTQEATTSVKLYTDALLKNAQAKSIQGKVEAEYSKKNENLLEIERLKEKREVQKSLTESKDFKGPYATGVSLNISEIDNQIDKLNNTNKLIDENIETYTSFYGKTYAKSTDTLKKNQAYLENELKNEKEKLSVLEEQQAARLFPANNKPSQFSNNWAESVATNEINKQVDLQREIVAEKQKALDLSIKQNQEETDLANPTATPTPPGKGDKTSVQREKINKVLKDLEEKHSKDMAALKKKYADGDIKTEYDYQQESLKQQNEYDDKRKKAIQKLLDDKSITDAELRINLTKELSDIEQKNYDRIIEQNKKIKKILLDADPIAAEKEEYNNRLRELELFGETQESLTGKIAKANTDKEKEALTEKLAAFVLLENKHKENLRKLDSKNAALRLKELATQQSQETADLADQRDQRLISEQEYKDKLLEIELKYLREKLKVNGLSADKIEEINKQVVDKLRETTENRTQTRESVVDKYNLQSPRDKYQTELDILKYYEQQGILTHEEAVKVKEQIDVQYFDNLTAKTREVLSGVGQIFGNVSSMYSDQQSAAESAVERRYKKEIAAAGNNSKKVAKLEEKKEAEIQAIRAKYADKQFILSVAQVISSTSVAAMEAYKAMAGIPVVGPALGAAAATAALAAGYAQIQTAKEQQEAAKKGYQIGGFTGSGNSDSEEAGIVHKNEFVANADAVRNPEVKKFLDVFDLAQKNGTIRMLNTTQILSKVKQDGYQSGGYTPSSNNSQIDTGVLAAMEVLITRNGEIMKKLSDQIDSGIYAVNQISGSGGLAEQLDQYEKIKRKVSRA